VFIVLNFISTARGMDAARYLYGNDWFAYFRDSFLKPMQIFMCGILAFNIFRKPEDLRQYLRIIKLASLMLGIWILCRGGGTIESAARLVRVSGLHKNSIGFMFAVLLVMNMATIKFGSKSEKIFSWILNGIYIWVIMFSFSRQGYVTAVIVLTIFAVKAGGKVTVAAIIGFFIFWNFLMPFEVKKRIFYGTETGVQMGDKEYTIGDVTSGRKEAWEATDKAIMDNLIFGQGRYAYLKLVYINRPDLPPHPHSAYRQCLLDMGIFGTAGFLGFYIYLMVRSWIIYKTSKSKFASAYSFGFFMCVMVFLLQAYTGFRLYPSEESYYIWLFLGGLMWIEKNQKYLSEHGM
ncbi:MAG: O-antigen ligase family protein, partial [Candidatus Omnitrophota bacterium]